MASEQSELLFFDTFSHEPSEELNLDLVQFTKTVCVTEVRVIPLGARVQADFPGGVRLGATNPSQFKIEFFVNDLSKPGASTFESVGGIEYNQNGNIHLESEQRIPTDGLVLRGWYTTITLAVYGYLTKAIVHEPPPPVSVPLQGDVGGNPTAEWVQHHSQVSEIAPDSYLEAPRDPYAAAAYPGGDYPAPHPEYPSHPLPYQEQWPQPTESYDSTAVAPPKDIYDGEPMSWDQRTPEDKSSWERKERERDMRHPRADREYRDHGRECSPDYERSRGPRGDYHYNRGPQQHRQWSGRPRSPPPHPRSGARTPPPPPQGDGEPRVSVSPPLQSVHSDHGSVKKEGTPPAGFDSLSPGDVESISEGEIPEAEGEVEAEVKEEAARVTQPTPPAPSPLPQVEDASLEAEPFEPILSDEEIGDDCDPQFQDLDYDFSEYSDDPLKTFNPYNCELQPFVFFTDPAKTAPERLKSEPTPTTKLSELLAAVPELRVTSAAREEWVHAAEKLVFLLPTTLCQEQDFDGVVDKVISWIEIGLNFEDALSQPQPGYKLRQIKAGIRLVEALCCCGEDVTDRLLAKINVHQKLIELYHQQYMALSIKLMILRSLDASLKYKNSVERFLKTDEWNGYQKLIEMVQAKQLARVQFAITSLLQKLHLYEVLDKLNKCIEELVTEEGKESEINEPADSDIETIVNSLEHIIRIYNGASKLIPQPKRFLPVSAQFEINSSSYPDPYPALFSYFRIHNLLGAFQVLLTHPGTCSFSSVVIPVHEMICSLQDTRDGLHFLSAVPKTINPLVRLLLGVPLAADETEESTPEANQLGLHLMYRLQALSHVDHLMHCWYGGKSDPDDSEVFDHLQALFCLTFGAVGKMAVVHVLSHGDHISVILKFVKEKILDKDAKPKKSPGKLYACDLITMTVKYSDHVPFLQKYSKEILDIAAKDPSQELNDLITWLKPVENPSAFSYDDISGLVDILKKNTDEASILSGELITAVRVLKYLGIPLRDHELSIPTPDSFEYVELKYKCVIIQLYSLDGLVHLSAIIQKLCENYEQPALHSARLVGRQGLALTSFLRLALQLIRKVLTHVIKCRNTEFKDLTMIPVLLQTYSLMQAIPLSAHCHIEAQKVCRDVVETLLAYTQPVSADPSSETEALNKSLWTLMMTEVLKYTVSTPNNFICGLSLISEMLPLPLQVQTRLPLPETEITRIVNSRKLWSAHLHCLSTLIHEVINTLSSSSYSPLLQLLRSVCVQLADLAAPTALTVTRAVLDSLVKALISPERSASSHLMRLLAFLACLATHASIKAAIIQLTIRPAAPDKVQQRYPDLVVSLCHVLRAPHDSPTHIQAQECILSVVQSLCHCELSLVPAPGAGGGGESYLANTLPPRDLLGTLVLVMLDHITDNRHGLATVQASLRTFLMLTEHDYGFFHLKNCLEKKTEALWNVVSKVVSVWSRPTERAECRDTLNTLLELLRNCLTPDAPDEVLGLPARQITASPPELANILGWERHTEENKHPVYAIVSLLQESRSEDETLETLCENVTELIRLLEEEGSKPLEPKEVTEPLLPSPDSLLAQFSARQVFVVGDVDDDRLTAGYWLTVPLPDDQDSEMQQVPCDLMEVAKAEVPDLPLAESVATLCRHKAAPGDLEHATPSGKKRANNLPSESNAKRPFITPMRGRGFRGGGGGGGGGGGSGQRGDMFRSRPPNTSRPPSLHVDDFVALETCGQQPTGPTGYNKISMRAAQDLMANRVRGRPRPFGMDRGGRFFPTPYSRRENGSGREGMSPHWHGDSSSGGSGSGTGSFRPPPPDMRGLRPSDAPHFRPQLRGPPPAHPWPLKDGRERFSSPPMRGGPQHRGEPNRHMRFFSR